MNVIEFDNIPDFAERVTPLLLAREAENNLMLGMIARFINQPRPDDVFLYAVEQDGRAIAAATIINAPNRIILSELDDAASEALAGYLYERGVSLPGGVGQSETAMRFADAWCGRTGMQATMKMSLRIYQLDRLEPIPPVNGVLREPREDDRELLLEWTRRFGEEIGEPHRDVAATLNRRLDDRQLFIWDNKIPVSMAGWAGPTPNGVRINAVYTPRHLRRRGYATACVAALTRRLLDSGKRFCFLYTDLLNPTSNSIYQKMGYRPVCDWKSYDFVARDR